MTSRTTLGATAGVALVATLAVASTLVGVADLDLFVLWESRIPRTIALVLTGFALAVTGLVMQLLTRNRFVEPSTTGAADGAALALLLVLLISPGLPLWAKACVTTVGAVAGVTGFLALVRRIPSPSSVLVPVVGIMYAGVVGSVTAFIAYRTGLLQELGSWAMGDFSGVLRTRYEMLWLAAAAAAVAWVAADLFTLAGLGEDTATGLGVDVRWVMVLGVVIVAAVTGVTTVTTGAIPFLGLVAPNVVSRLIGDNMRSAVPLVGLLGAAVVLGCDVIGRVVRFPYEIPIGVVVGVLGAAMFLWLLLGPATRRQAGHA
ncbi:ABC transporter permease [Xylanimonas allomyrinae]|uniref:ABC transporter permease n=1 Tax=Xylanimonas allomyrinae TaxID=2509459 RepID=A0A4P6ENT1_9MICO|nr:iron chelate uptake ABC transporter family permease subunit [Xylanimonas allomyrinae]QAY62999.1 ABC transporter permease [Xylanimonas allomyrinae]